MDRITPSSSVRDTGIDHRQAGLTLIELMVTLAVAAILLTIAVPNFITFVQNNRLTSQGNDLVTALNYARSEAIKRGVRVTVCSRSSDTACVGGGADWANGWLVFVDTNGDGDVGGEAVLQVRRPLENGNTLTSAVAFPRVTYQNSGFSGFAGTLRLCDARGTASARAIVMSPQGRVRTGPLAAEGLTCP